ncbi:MAG: DUF427 domain-containing protein [Pseudolabrys sp.]|nr:DUF427 domain-containing protein [Pseudolabrys sp.]
MDIAFILELKSQIIIYSCARENWAENAGWSYAQPFPAMAEIAGHLAFYPSRVDKIEES